MRGLGNIVIGGLFVFGGLTGSMALRGTGSSGALALVGIVLLIMGLVQATSGGQDSNAIADEEEELERLRNAPPAPRKVAAPTPKPDTTEEYFRLLKDTPGAGDAVAEVLARVGNHLDEQQRSDLALETARRLNAEHLAKQQA